MTVCFSTDCESPRSHSCANPALRCAGGRILARLLTDPEKSYSLSDLVTWSRTSMSTVQREIDRAEQAGIVTTEKVGPTRLVRANGAPSPPRRGMPHRPRNLRPARHHR